MKVSKGTIGLQICPVGLSLVQLILFWNSLFSMEIILHVLCTSIEHNWCNSTRESK